MLVVIFLHSYFSFIRHVLSGRGRSWLPTTSHLLLLLITQTPLPPLVFLNQLCRLLFATPVRNGFALADRSFAHCYSTPPLFSNRKQKKKHRTALKSARVNAQTHACVHTHTHTNARNQVSQQTHTYTHLTVEKYRHSEKGREAEVFEQIDSLTDARIHKSE